MLTGYSGHITRFHNRDKNLSVDGDEALEDIARFVGHAKPSTTAGCVNRLD